MRGLTAFAKKEVLEQIRSYKALILLAVLFLFGMTSPLLAKMMPELLKNFSGSGITITVPATTVTDAWAQFFKNIGQMGLIVLLLLFGSSFPQEVNRGTLVIPLSKGLSRNAVILAKYATALLSWTVGYVLSVLICCVYTQYLFGQFVAPQLLFSLFCMWLFGAFLLALLLFTGATVSGNYGGLLFSVLILGVLLVLDTFSKLQRWNPMSLALQNTTMMTKASVAADIEPAVWITIGCIIVLGVFSSLLFQRKAL